MEVACKILNTPLRFEMMAPKVGDGRPSKGTNMGNGDQGSSERDTGWGKDGGRMQERKHGLLS